MASDSRYVAHIDILGMSSLVYRNAEEAWGLLSDLAFVRDSIQGVELEFTDLGERVRAPASVAFSDTIILFTKDDSTLSLRSIVVIATELFQRALSKCVPTRIGIAGGKFFFNFEKSMYAGPALIDAYRLGESTQWLGISLSDSVGVEAKKLGLKSGDKDLIVEYPVPLKPTGTGRYVISWPIAVKHAMTREPPISVSQFYEAFERTFGPFESLDISARTKYENTVDFLNAQLESGRNRK